MFWFIFFPGYYQLIQSFVSENKLLLIDRHHMEVIEYSLDPIEIYLLSVLSNIEFISFAEVNKKINAFFENIDKKEIPNHMEEAIRFLSYSGVIFLRFKE